VIFPPPYQEQYTYEDFVQSLNDSGLHLHLLAKGATTIEDSVRWGVAYLLAIQLHQQEQLPPAQVAATTTTTVDAEIGCMAEVLTQLMVNMSLPTFWSPNGCRRHHSGALLHVGVVVEGNALPCVFIPHGPHTEGTPRRDRILSPRT